MKTLLAVILLSALSFGQTSTQEDAGALEARYGTCEKHHIPSDKCTVAVYRQLEKKDSLAALAKAKRELFMATAERNTAALHYCTGLSVVTPEARKMCSEAAEWLTSNGLADVVKREADLVKKQACEKDGRGAWIVPSAACGKACGSEPHCDVYK